MSNIAIKGATTGTGTFTIESPATNTDRTLTLPDEAGTVLTSASTLSSSNLSGALPAIDGSALTGLAGGTLVKVTTHTRSTTYETSSSTSSAPTELVQSHTMESSANKLYVFVAGVVGRGSQNGGIQGILKFDGVFLEHTKVRAGGALDNDRYPFGSAIIDGYTGAKTFEVHIASTPNNAKAQLVGGSTLVIMEYTP